MIKFLDLEAMNRRLLPELEQVLLETLRSGRYILGERVADFEQRFATYCGTDHCIGVNSGLDALTIMLEGYKQIGQLSRGDEVIVPANTFIATLLAISAAGLVPIPVEPDEKTFNLDPEQVRKAIGARTRAIMAVHLYGRLAPMQELDMIAKENGLLLLEDAAQAHGAVAANVKAGAWGDAAGFSFYPGKNLGAMGDAGAITTSNTALAEAVIQFRNYGSPEKYVHSNKGVNSRSDELQAAFLSIKLKHLDEGNEKRRQIAAAYGKGISNPLVKTPELPSERLSHVWHLYVVRCEHRDRLKEHLFGKGVETIMHYPTPPHRQGAFPELQHLQLPITEKLHREVISLPLHPELSAEQVGRIIEAVNTFS